MTKKRFSKIFENSDEDWEFEGSEVCKKCGMKDLTWERGDIGWYLVQPDGNVHGCPRRRRKGSK